MSLKGFIYKTNRRFDTLFSTAVGFLQDFGRSIYGFYTKNRQSVEFILTNQAYNDKI